jgi:hypothetical protein
MKYLSWTAMKDSWKEDCADLSILFFVMTPLLPGGLETNRLSLETKVIRRRG